MARRNLISFPVAMEAAMIDDLDECARLEGVSRAEYIRRVVAADGVRPPVIGSVAVAVVDPCPCNCAERLRAYRWARLAATEDGSYLKAMADCIALLEGKEFAP